MRPFLSKFTAGALAWAVVLAGAAPLGAAPMLRPAVPATGSDVVPVVNSKTVRRESSQHDGKAWKKRRHRSERHDGARAERQHRKPHKAERRRRNGDDWLYRPRATPKYAYDAYGNFRVHDGDGWKGDHERDGRRHRKDRHRPLILNRSYKSTVPSPELQQILTAAPKIP